MSRKVRLSGRAVRRFVGSAVALVVCCVAATARGAVSSSGNVVPVPPVGGGAFAGPFEIGDVDVGTVSISGGTAISHTGAALLGDAVTGIGIASLSGLGSDWTLTTGGADMTVANNGTGSLALSNLAFLSVNDDLVVAAQLNSMGRITIGGLGTIVDVGDDANIGQRGQAVVDIFSGGRLVTDQNIIGDEPDGDGRVIVQDQFSLWRTSNTITVADAGRAALQVLDGGRLETTAPLGNVSATIASQAGSTGTVEVIGAGSNWQNVLGMVIGEFGNGRLTVADGGLVSSSTGVNLFTIGRQIGSVGSVEVRGVGSLLTAAIIEVGDSGDGTLRILSGGRVVTGTAIIGDNSSARGDVLVDGVGSAWEVTGEINVADPGEAGLTISNGALVRSSSITRVGALGRLTLDAGRLEIGGTVGLLNAGVVEGAGTIEALKVDNNAGGRIRPDGVRPLIITGTLNNLGLVEVAGGTLEVMGPTNNNLDIDARDGAVLRFRGLGLDNNSGAQLAITSGLVDVFGSVANDAGAEIVVGGTATAVFHDVVTNNGTVFVQPGGKVLMLENLGFSAASTLGLPLSVGGPQPLGQVDVAGNVTLAGTVEVAVTGPQLPLPGDQFTFLTSEGRTGTFDAVNSSGAPGLEFHTIYTATDATLFVVGAGDRTWGVDADGNASVASNWLGGVAPGGVNDKAVFSTIVTANRVVTVDAPMTVGSLTFDDNNSYSLTGPAGITLDVSSGSARINVLNAHGTGSHSLAVPVMLNDNTIIDVAAGSSVAMSGQMTAAPGVGITKSGAGRLVVKNVRASALSVDGGMVQVLPSSGVDGVSVVDALAIAPGATMDLMNNDLVVNGGNVADVTGMIAGHRLTTSAASPITTLGVILNGSRYTTFSGQGVSADDVLVKYTYFGDTNLDGRVSIADYLAVDRGFARGSTGWGNGDFDYSGVIDGADYFLMDQAFLGQTGILAAHAGGTVSTPVPEPVCLACLGLGAGLLGRRRNRCFSREN